MGTRSLTSFFEKGDEKPFATMYRQFDGYLEGHGNDLAEFLKERARVNGISDETAENAANGMGCLAAQCVAWFKTGRHYKGGKGHGAKEKELQIGEIYLHAYGDCGQEFEYEVRPDAVENELFGPRKKAGWLLTAYSTGRISGKKKLFDGTPEEFLRKLEADEFNKDD